MTAIGTTTAMAMVPPFDSPLDAVAGMAVLLEWELEVELVEVPVFDPDVVAVVGTKVLVEV
jgi:hypothetical protein